MRRKSVPCQILLWLEALHADTVRTVRAPPKRELPEGINQDAIQQYATEGLEWINEAQKMGLLLSDIEKECEKKCIDDGFEALPNIERVAEGA